MGQTVVEVPPVGYLVLVLWVNGGDVGYPYAHKGGGIHPVKHQVGHVPVVLCKQNTVRRLEIGLAHTDIVLQGDENDLGILGVVGIVAAQ